MVQLLRDYVEEHGALPKTSQTGHKIMFQGVDIGTWISTQRRRYAEGKLPEDHVEALEAVPGWWWKVSGGSSSEVLQTPDYIAKLLGLSMFASTLLLCSDGPVQSFSKWLFLS